MTIATAQALMASELSSHRLRVVIVDNGSGTEDVRAFTTVFHSSPNVDIIALPNNRGYAAGNNAGMQHALSRSCCSRHSSNDAVLLLNSDVIVRPDSLQICLDHLRDHPNTGIVGPRVLLPDGKLDLACRRSFPNARNSFWKLTGLAKRFPENRRFAQYNLTYLNEYEMAEVDSVMGAFMLVRRAAIDDAGSLDPDFFMYGEDLDWSYRIKAHGWKIVYLPETSVEHLKGATSRRQSNRMIYQFYRSMWLFHKKHYADKTLFLLNWLIMFGIVVRGTIAFGRNLFRPAAKKRVS